MDTGVFARAPGLAPSWEGFGTEGAVLSLEAGPAGVIFCCLRVNIRFQWLFSEVLAVRVVFIFVFYRFL